MSFRNMRRLLLITFFMVMLVGTASALTFINYTVNASDGNAYRAVHNATFTDLRDGAGNGVDTTGSTLAAYVQSDLTTNTYYRVYRTALIFDTSGLPDDAVISSAIVGVYRFSNYVTLGDTGLNIVNFTVEGTIDAADYDNFGSLRFSTDQNASTILTAKYYNFSLNAAGIANISKTGNSGFGSRFGFDIDNLSPEWASGGSKYAGAAWRPADYVVYPTFIEITYTVPTPTPTITPYAFPDWGWCGEQDIFFRNDSSDIAGYFVMDHRPQIEDTKYFATTVSSGTGSKRIATWATNTSSPGVSMIGPGLWRFRVYLNVSSAVGNTNFEFKIFNRSADGTETDLFYGHVISKDINDLTPTEHLISYARRNYTQLFEGDRLVITVNASTSSVAARDAYIWVAGNNYTSMVESGYYLCPAELGASGNMMLVESPIAPEVSVYALALAASGWMIYRRRKRDD